VEWKKDTAENSNSEMLFLGPWVVGYVEYDSLSSKDDMLKYVAACKLPGVTGHTRFSTAQEGKKDVESAVEYWLSQLPEQKEN
jgi:hypothetical protein